jgi:non-ribosomal peptide synthetase component F
LGYPVQETEVVLLNEDGSAAEIYGEIGIRSEHVALGYWRRPELTKAVFLPEPEGGSRQLYRTGDLGRLTADGSIRFLGRRDHQVKIRGYRVEVGEIETVLAHYTGVQQAVVLARQDAPEDKRLVAYVVPDRSASLTAIELRNYLKLKLPEYMIPAAFVMLDSLPLTPNGKLDRKALPAPSLTSPELNETFVAPRTAVETKLASIWSDVLKVDKVGIHDNFFDLGGHSLLATQVVSRVHEAFHIELPLRTLFEYPTVSGLAEQIAQSEAPMISQEEMTNLLANLESLSDEEARAHLSGLNGAVVIGV